MGAVLGTLALPFVIGLLVALGATFACEAVALRIGLVTRPREDRWHRQTIPLLGGVAIMLGALAALALIPSAVGRFGGFLVAALIIGGAGLVDDVVTLRPQAKLVVQIVLAAVLIQFGFVLGLTDHPVVNLFLTLFWIVGITNAFNLLDNMDGLAAGMALIVGSFRLVFFLMDGDATGAAVTAGFVGAVAAFLVRNFPPAKIFMGDAGSLFIGFFLGGLCLGGQYYSRGIAAVLVFPVLLMLIPIFDTTFVTLTRLVTGRPVSQGGRDHTSHRLVSLGISERQALGFLCGVSVLAGLLATFSYQYGFTYTVVLLALLLVGLFLLGVYLSRVQVIRVAGTLPAESRIVRLAADFPFKRQVATVMIDLVLIVAAYYAAYLLRFEAAFDVYRETFFRTVAPVIIIQVSAMALSGSYRGLWRYTSLPELVRLLRGATLGSSATVLYMLFTTRFENLSRAVFILDWLLLVVFLSGSRASFRVFAELLRPARTDFRRVLIYGAGDGGELTLRELRKNSGLRREAVGFLDDDPAKAGTRIHGVPVLGGVETADGLVARYGVAEVIVASDRISVARVQRLETICAARGIRVVRAALRIE